MAEILPNNFLNLLENFFNQVLQQSDTESNEDFFVVPSRFYAMRLNELLNLNIELTLRQFFMKTKGLNWAEFYSVKLLWQYKPQVLFDLVTADGKKKLSDNFRIDASNIKY